MPSVAFDLTRRIAPLLVLRSFDVLGSKEAMESMCGGRAREEVLDGTIGGLRNFRAKYLENLELGSEEGGKLLESLRVDLEGER